MCAADPGLTNASSLSPNPLFPAKGMIIKGGALKRRSPASGPPSNSQERALIEAVVAGHMSMSISTRSKSATTQSLDALSLLTLNPGNSEAALEYVARLTPRQRGELLSLADSHHVVVRALTAVRDQASSIQLRDWAETANRAERARIAKALPLLALICHELETAGAPVVVMKSLDHWPDLGNDLDLYTSADEQTVLRVMVNRLGARVEPQSWGDRLAHKWNFALPDLREAVEVHVNRLGQTGEHVEMARRFVTRRVPLSLEGHTFLVPAPEERVIVATLQRMYRHFYLRICDMANTAALMESKALDYKELATASEIGGIWSGVATYLCLVSDYLWKYRGVGFRLPPEVVCAARFGGDSIFVQGKFLRVPKMPQGAGLYVRQVARALSRHDWSATARLSLLPPLASVAAVAYAITGSDKGIW